MLTHPALSRPTSPRPAFWSHPALRRLACTVLVALGVAVGSAAAHAQPTASGPYAEVCFTQPTAALVQDLAQAGLALDHAHTHKTPVGVETCAVLNAEEQARLGQRGIAHRLAVPDLEAVYNAQLPRRQATLEAMRSRTFDLDRFEFGSVGGFYSFDEVVAKLDQLRADFPDLITEKVSLGQSYEGRELWMVEVSDNPGVDEGEPEVLYTALHHAREPQSMATVVYFLVYLLERYGTDPEVTYLVDNRRLVFVPVLNPDGYVHNEATNPSGGGLWRKNRRPLPSGDVGVDLNRNYGVEWGRDNQGSSPETFSETYRGPAPFSEPETAALRDFIEQRQFRTAFNYHSRGNLLIYPWGYEQNLYTPDSARYVDFAAAMTLDNGYRAGTVNQVLGYVANGSSDDWMYGEQATKPAIFAFTPEVNDRSQDGFWTPPGRIEARAKENLEANLVLAFTAGGFPDVRFRSISEVPQVCETCVNGFIDPGERALVNVDLRNLGLDPLGATVVRLVSTTSIFEGGSEVMVDPLALDASTEVALAVDIAADAPLGQGDGLVVEVDVAGITRAYPLPPVTIGTADPLLVDAALDLRAWTTTGTAEWGLDGPGSVGPTAFADSPGQDYLDATEAVLELRAPVDLSDAEAVVLSFDTRWTIEDQYDAAQVLVATGDDDFVPVAGRYTKPGSGLGVQAEDAPVYDGVQADWVREEIDLSAFAGEPAVTIAFRLTSDGLITRDGWWVDEVTVVTLIDGSAVSNENQPAEAALALAAPYPNPSAERLTVPLTLPATMDVRVEVFDVLGRRVAVLADESRAAGTHALVWDGRSASGARVGAGTYVVRLVADGQVQAQRFAFVP
ncbi:MAG: M14 family zinc carboxypeptidase [Bacteroidota bacterium]